MLPVPNHVVSREVDAPQAFIEHDSIGDIIISDLRLIVCECCLAHSGPLFDHIVDDRPDVCVASLHKTSLVVAVEINISRCFLFAAVQVLTIWTRDVTIGPFPFG